MLSQYINNILMHTDRCQKKDFALYTFLQESNFHSMLQYYLPIQVYCLCLLFLLVCIVIKQTYSQILHLHNTFC